MEQYADIAIPTSEEKYRALLDVLDDAVFATDMHGVIVEANARATGMTGYSAGEFPGKDLMNMILRDDREAYALHRKESTVQGRSTVQVRMTTRGGQTIEVVLSTTIVDASTALSVIRDVTETNRRERDLQLRNREALALYGIGREIAASIEVDRVLSKIVTNTIWVMEAHVAGVAMLDPATDTVSWRTVSGAHSDVFRRSVVPNGKDLAGTIIRHNAPMLLKSFPDDPRVDPSDYPVVAEAGLKTVLGIPLATKGKVFGMLMCGYRDPHIFSENQVRLLFNLSDQAALAIENARLYQSSVEHSRNLEALSTQLADVQEEERKSISFELHEGLAQVLSGIRFNLDLFERDSTPEDRLRRLDELRGIIDDTLVNIKEMAISLRPPALDDFGLVSALRLYVDRVSKKTEIAIRLEAPESVGRWGSTREAALYRVIQEAVENIVRHSGAREAILQLSSDEKGLSVDIEDNGRGFDPASVLSVRSHRDEFGVLAMRERMAAIGGTFDIRSSPGTGTRIRLHIPVEP